jgi:hypothetical protein
MTKNNDQSGNPFEAFNTNGDNLKKISDVLLNKYKGKVLELYIGDQCETLNFDDFSVPQNCSIFGKLVDVLDRFVILDCYYIDHKTKQLKTGHNVYINAFQIRAFTEIDGNGSLGDVFLHVNDAKVIRNLLLRGGG